MIIILIEEVLMKIILKVNAEFSTFGLYLINKKIEEKIIKKLAIIQRFYIKKKYQAMMIFYT